MLVVVDIIVIQRPNRYYIIILKYHNMSCICIYIFMEVSWNGGIPKSSILMGFSIINHPFEGTPIYGMFPLFKVLLQFQIGFLKGTQGTWWCKHVLKIAILGFPGPQYTHHFWDSTDDHRQPPMQQAPNADQGCVGSRRSEGYWHQNLRSSETIRALG